jgi:Tfp pilus assembly protein FimT
MRRERAFSLIELVVIVFVVGILALAAAPSFERTLLEYEVDHAAVETQNLVRYARSLTVTGTPYYVEFDAGENTISVFDVENDTPAPDPMRKSRDYVLRVGAGSPFSHTRLLTADFSGSSRLRFDRLGNASSGGAIELAAGGFTRTIKVAGPGGKTTVE